ncbi:family 10 glycosylhydrolase [Flavisolibacter sp. BT320]|nr:family 10 glycosylhydrolase [Flavisolibacter longurius]
MAACTVSKPAAEKQKAQKAILWFDATANFHRFTFKDSITYYLQQSKDAGVTDVVIDVKPITGEVLYPSKIAPQMLEWKSGKEAGRKDPSWDMLSYFIEEGHRLGLSVHASTNVFVAGHNFFDRGMVYEDKSKEHWQTVSHLPEGMVPITRQKKKYSAMLNPALPDVQVYELSILKELAALYPKLNGIILDRVRYDAITADFSDASRRLFEAHLGQKVANWPADIFSYTSSKEQQRVEGPLYKQWLEWRAKVIHDFFVKARGEIKKINPNIIFGDYTGAWYNTYYEVGVNWASKTYDPSKDYAWATANYHNYGYAETLDLFTTGNYFFEVTKEEVKKTNAIKAARTEAGMESRRDTIYSVEGSAEIASRVTKGVVPVYAGLYVEQYKSDPEQFVKALKMCRAESQGAMVFDIVHIINYGWWSQLKKGLTEDPQTLN